MILVFLLLLRNPNHPFSCFWGPPEEGCYACPSSPSFRGSWLVSGECHRPCHIHSHSNLILSSWAHANMLGHLQTHTKPPLHLSLAGPQQKCTAPLPSMCLSVPLAQGRDCHSLPASPHSCSLLTEPLVSELSPSLSLSPEHTKEGYKVGFFLYRNKRLTPAFLFSYPSSKFGKWKVSGSS